VRSWRKKQNKSPQRHRAQYTARARPPPTSPAAAGLLLCGGNLHVARRAVAAPGTGRTRLAGQGARCRCPLSLSLFKKEKGEWRLSAAGLCPTRGFDGWACCLCAAASNCGRHFAPRLGTTHSAPARRASPTSSPLPAQHSPLASSP
jgi:hypothetical protein